MINDTGYDVAVPGRAGRDSGTSPATRIRPQVAFEPALLRWGRRLAQVGQVGLVAFAAVALISANREAGLLTFGAVAQISSAVRGHLQVGVVFLLLPLGAVFWLAGHWMMRRVPNQLPGWRVGPPIVFVPMAVLIALTFAHLTAAIGWADITFVLAGLGLLALTYLFVLNNGLSDAALAGFIAAVGCVQAAVGVGQFIYQHDLGLRWLGELSLDPAVSGVSVVDNAARVLRAYGLMRHPNALGAILPLSLLAALSSYMRAGERERIGWLLATVVITAGLVLSFSRAGWLAALVGMGILLVVHGAPFGGTTGRPGPLPWRSWAPALLSAALVLIVIVSLQPGLFLGRFVGAFGNSPGLENGSTSTRLSSAQFAWDVIRRWPLWGVGTRRYVVVAAQSMNVVPDESLMVESTPLVMWAELGLAAPVAWLGMGLALVGAARRRAAARASNTDLALATAWVVAVQVVSLFQAFFWPTYELWQGGIWLGAALGLWAYAWSNSL